MSITPDEIVKRAQKCLREDARHAGAFSALGMAYYDKGMMDKALQFFKKAVEEDPEYAPAYAGLGMVFGKKGLVDESISNLKEAISKAPNCALLYNWLGDAFFDQGRIEDAIREYGRATELDSLDSNAHNDLADAYRMRGEFEKALDHYRKTIRIDPGDTNAILEQAQVMIHLNRRDEAKKILLAMIENFSESEDTKTAKVVLGSMYAQEGDFISARDFLMQAARHYPFNPSIQFQLGLCHLILEEEELALDHLQRANDLDPNNTRVMKLLERVRGQKA